MFLVKTRRVSALIPTYNTRAQRCISKNTVARPRFVLFLAGIADICPEGTFMEKEIYRITEDLMLGDLKIVQDKRLYRFTSDSILLSRFADSYSDERVRESSACIITGLIPIK